MKRNVLIAVSIFLVIWVTIFSLLGNGLKKNHILTKGVITSIDNGGKGNFGPGIKYQYFVERKLIYGNTRDSRLKYSIDNFIGKSFPVVYRWNGLCYDDKILITPYDFERYGYVFPDSLNWVLEYVEE